MGSAAPLMPPWTPGRIQAPAPLRPPAAPHTTKKNRPLRRHRPHVLRAASAFRSRPQGGFREPRNFRRSELFDWLHFVPPARCVASWSVIDAPKKNSGGTRTLAGGVALGFPRPPSRVPRRRGAPGAIWEDPRTPAVRTTGRE